VLLLVSSVPCKTCGGCGRAAGETGGGAATAGIAWDGQSGCAAYGTLGALTTYDLMALVVPATEGSADGDEAAGDGGGRAPSA
jgi:hypothetical protein